MSVAFFYTAVFKAYWDGSDFNQSNDDTAAVKVAGQSVGRLLKQALDEDKFEFKEIKEYVTHYKWLEAVSKVLT